MIQAQLYSYILNEVVRKDEYFKDFKIAHYTFIPINRVTLAPLVWRYYENFAQVDMIGDDGKVYRNWRKLLTELDYYLKNPDIKYTKDVRDRNGVMKISNLKSA